MYRLLYCSSRMPRRISSASHKPSVVISLVVAPVRVKVALVVTPPMVMMGWRE